MLINGDTRQPIRIGKRRFILLLLVVFLASSAGFAAYTLTYIGTAREQTREADLVKRPKFLHSIFREGSLKLSAPLSVASQNGEVYVADSENGRLAVFTTNGQPVRTVRLSRGLSFYPIGIAVDDRGRAYVSVKTGSRYRLVQIDRYGRPLGDFPNYPARIGINQSILNRPMGLFYGDGKLFVTDAGDHDVKIFSIDDGKLLKRFGGPGTKLGQFMFPHGIVADENYIYVVDSNNSRVQVFDKDGNFKYLFKPDKKNSLVIPRGIAIDRLERVHVVDLAQQKVFVFAKTGKFLFSYGDEQGNGLLSFPNGIAIDHKSGKVFIADRQNQRIAVYSY